MMITTNKEIENYLKNIVKVECGEENVTVDEAISAIAKHPLGVYNLMKIYFTYGDILQAADDLFEDGEITGQEYDYLNEYDFPCEKIYEAISQHDTVADIRRNIIVEKIFDALSQRNCAELKLSS